MKMNEELAVYLFGKEVGTLKRDNGYLTFQYNNKAKFPISINLPIRKEPYDNEETQKFFANLLPEGTQREIIVKYYNIKEDLFSLLKQIGGECAGAISLYSKTNPIKEVKNAKLFTKEEFNKHIKELPQKPLSIGNRVRISLAGAQAKTAVLIKDFENLYTDFKKKYKDYKKENLKNYKENYKVKIPKDLKIYRPSKIEFSTHIIKPPISWLKDSIYNELFCMTLAYNLEHIVGKMSFFIPRAHLYKDKNIECLFVQRYDRYRDKEQWKLKERLHQEDMCQVFSIFPEKKYQEDSGLSIKKIFSFIQKELDNSSNGMERFLNIIIFNFLIGNCDAHGKNFSILHNTFLCGYAPFNILFGKFCIYKSDTYTLAPFYDLMSTEIYLELGVNQTMAMSINNKYNPKNIRRIHFEKMAKELDIKPKYLLKLVDNIRENIVKEAVSLKKEFERQNIMSPVFNKIINLIRRRVKQIK